MTTYHLKDLQGAGLKEDYIFNNLEEIKENLYSYHAQDCEITSEHTLLYLLDLGGWAIIDNATGEEIDYNLITI